MTGAVGDFLVPKVRIRLRGPTGVALDLSAMVDTGFTEILALPEELVTELKLERDSGATMLLADETQRDIDVYEVDIARDGVWVSVLVHEIGDEPIVGMRLIAGLELTVHAVPGGRVAIAPPREVEAVAAGE